MANDPINPFDEIFDDASASSDTDSVDSTSSENDFLTTSKINRQQFFGYWRLIENTKDQIIKLLQNYFGIMSDYFEVEIPDLLKFKYNKTIEETLIHLFKEFPMVNRRFPLIAVSVSSLREKPMLTSGDNEIDEYSDEETDIPYVTIGGAANIDMVLDFACEDAESRTKLTDILYMGIVKFLRGMGPRIYFEDNKKAKTTIHILRGITIAGESEVTENNDQENILYVNRVNLPLMVEWQSDLQARMFDSFTRNLNI